MDGEILYDEKLQAFEAVRELDKLRKSIQHCDFIIKVGDEEIPVHRQILIANSEYFRAMFSHDTLEKQTGRVELKDMDVECVKIAVNFIYCGKITITENKIDQFLRVAGVFQIRNLMHFIVSFLEGKMNSKTFYIIKNLADKHNCSDLARMCDMFAFKNFDDIAKHNEEFNRLTEEYVAFLIFSKENRSCETLKLKVLLDWIRFDSDNRTSSVYSMLEKFQLSEILPQERRYLIEKEPLTSQSLECVKLLTASLLDGLKASALNLNLLREPNCIACFDGTSKHLQYYDPVKNTVTKLHPLKDDVVRDNFCPVVLGDSVYILMKYKAFYCLTYFEGNASWERLEDTIEDHGTWPQAVADSRYIYALGNWSAGSTCRRGIECYDVLRNRWTLMTHDDVVPNSVTIHLQKRIYCIGGKENEKCLKSVKAFDLISKKWINKAPLLNARCNAAVTTNCNNIYVFGGQDPSKLSSLEHYNVENDTWVLLNPMLMPRVGLKAFAIGGDIYAVGDYNERPSSIEKYTISEDRWERLVIPTKMDILWSVALTTH